MGLFRPYERSEADAEHPQIPSEASAPAPTPGKPAKKDVPTPSRREAEAARRERLNPSLSPKELRAKERQAKAAMRDEQFSKAEATPGKVLLRDFVDSRRGIAQWSLPLMMITLAVSLAVSMFSPEAATSITVFTYSMFLLIILDLIVMWRRFRKLAAQRIPNESLKGLLGYMLNRSINLRRLRMPAPRVKPGDPI